MYTIIAVFQADGVTAVMHIFLTGQIQAGKSTVMIKTLSLLNVDVGGFSTYFGADRKRAERCLYIRDASRPMIFDERYAVARFSQGYPPEVNTDAFDTLGTEFLRSARSKRVILMDECGSLEQKARIFQREVLQTLDGVVPVLGVVKQSSRGWTDQIRHHPNVRLITVDAGNRDVLPGILAEMIKAVL
jgi:nucleoside-triphosphatase